MSNVTRPSQHRARVILATSAGMMLVLFLAQCRPIADNVLGVKFEANFAKSASSCVAACQTVYNNQISAESTLHVLNVKACADDSLCLALEEIRHEAAVNSIQDARLLCANSCHHQGGGTGGR